VIFIKSKVFYLSHIKTVFVNWNAEKVCRKQDSGLDACRSSLETLSAILYGKKRTELPWDGGCHVRQAGRQWDLIEALSY